MSTPMRTIRITALLALLLASRAQAAEFYPKAISLRAYGTDQGNVGDCSTAAEVGALESIFASRGLGFVQLSLFYRHAASWVDQELQPVTRLALDAADKDFIHRAGPLLPDFMWPENSRGYDPGYTGLRPHPAQAVVYDPDFPSASTMGFSKNYYQFGKNGSLDSLKAAVAGGNAVVIALHGDLFQPNYSTKWDHVDGFLSTPYSWDKLMEDLRKDPDIARDGKEAETGVNHAMMVVGFDDSLYAGQYPHPGAIIVRNSWNNSSEMGAALARPTPEEAAALPLMRLKVYSRNLPGFYALPYQYVLDLQANKVGDYRVLGLDYSAFAAKYAEISSRYHIQTLPYVCDGPLRGTFRLADAAKHDVKKFGAAYKKLMDPAIPEGDRAQAAEYTYKIALREMQGRQNYTFGNNPAFRYARLSSHDGLHVDRADDFYAGKYLSYYCPEATNVWPTAAQLAAPGVRDSMRELSDSTFVNWYQFLGALSAAPQ